MLVLWAFSWDTASWVVATANVLWTSMTGMSGMSGGGDMGNMGGY